VSYQCKWIRCGKAACKSCPHGPYWYRFWRDGSSTRCEYIGKELPRDAESGGESATNAGDMRKTSSPFEAMLNQRTASIALAYEILGVGASTAWAAIKDKYKRLMMQHHPDRGGSIRMSIYINAAFEYLKKARR
jgi:hypothetical protein